MRPISLACVAAAAACAVPAGASAATLTSNKPCYLEGESATLAGEGYTPGAPVSFAFDGSSAGQQPADAAGRVFAGFTAPGSIGAVSVREYTVTASDAAGNTSTTSVAVTKRELDIRPSSGSPRRRVRFSVRGMVPGRALYAHYVLRGRERARASRPRRRPVRHARQARPLLPAAHRAPWQLDDPGRPPPPLVAPHYAARPLPGARLPLGDVCVMERGAYRWLVPRALNRVSDGRRAVRGEAGVDPRPVATTERRAAFRLR